MWIQLADQENLNFNPDSVQQQILDETAKRILVLAPRQTGKSTAAAVRVIHEAVHKENASILLASASGDLLPEHIWEEKPGAITSPISRTIASVTTSGLARCHQQSSSQIT